MNTIIKIVINDSVSKLIEKFASLTPKDNVEWIKLSGQSTMHSEISNPEWRNFIKSTTEVKVPNKVGHDVFKVYTLSTSVETSAKEIDVNGAITGLENGSIRVELGYSVEYNALFHNLVTDYDNSTTNYVCQKNDDEPYAYYADTYVNKPMPQPYQLISRGVQDKIAGKHTGGGEERFKQNLSKLDGSSKLPLRFLKRKIEK